jgi:hypothetical protein
MTNPSTYEQLKAAAEKETAYKEVSKLRLTNHAVEEKTILERSQENWNIHRQSLKETASEMFKNK